MMKFIMSHKIAAAIIAAVITAGTVTGVVDGMEFTVLGADSVRYEGNDYIVFFYDAVNRGDALDAVWLFECDAAQDGEFLEETWDLDSIVPEHYNVNYDIYPGRTIRCASVFPFDPEGGVVGLRIGDYDSDSTVLYYADPQDLSGAPAEPFVFDADPSIPEELAALPREAGDVRIEDAEFFTEENGAAAVRFYFRYLNGSSYDYYARLLQDGIEVMYNWDDVERQEEDPEDEERLRSLAYTLRTGSPVVFVMYEEGASGTDTPVAAMVMEVG